MKRTPACPRFPKMQQSTQHSSFSFPAMLDVADRPVANSHARKFCRAICIGAAVTLLAGRIVHAEPASTSAAQVAPDPVAAPVTEAAQRSGIPASWISTMWPSCICSRSTRLPPVLSCSPRMAKPRSATLSAPSASGWELACRSLGPSRTPWRNGALNGPSMPLDRTAA